MSICSDSFMFCNKATPIRRNIFARAIVSAQVFCVLCILTEMALNHFTKTVIREPCLLCCDTRANFVIILMLRGILYIQSKPKCP